MATMAASSSSNQPGFGIYGIVNGTTSGNAANGVGAVEGFRYGGDKYRGAVVEVRFYLLF